MQDVTSRVRLPSFFLYEQLYCKYRRKITEETNAQYSSHMHQSAVMAHILALGLRLLNRMANYRIPFSYPVPSVAH